jgi:hypothetical protein
METTYFGAKALVYLKYAGEISKLAKILSDEFQLPEFYFDTNEETPHEVFGMSETLGFELWLNKSIRHEGFSFEIQIETSMDVKDKFETVLFDLSSWFATEISRRCEIETYF